MRTVSKRLIVVEDVYEFTQRERSLLNREEFNLVVVRSGDEALFRAQNDRPDLLILDFYMPDLNGYQVCRKLKEDSSTENIPVIILAPPADEDNDPGFLTEAAGCSGCVEKPLDYEDIVPLTEECLDVPPRRHRRIPASLPCRFTDEDGQREAATVNISPYGLCMEAEPAPWAGDIIKADMSLEGASMNFQMAVRWSTEEGAGGPGKAGCEFLGAPAELLEWLEGEEE